MNQDDEFDYEEYRRKMWIQFGKDLCSEYKQLDSNQKDEYHTFFKKYLIPSGNGKLYFHPKFVMNQIVNYANVMDKYDKDKVINFINLPILDQMKYIYESTRIEEISKDIRDSIDNDFKVLRKSIMGRKLEINDEFEHKWSEYSTKIMNNFVEYTLVINRISEQVEMEKGQINYLLLPYYQELVEGNIKSDAYIIVDLIIRRDGTFKYESGKKEKRINKSEMNRIKRISLYNLFKSLKKFYSFNSFNDFINLELRNNIAHNSFHSEKENIILDNGDIIEDMRIKCDEVRDFAQYFNFALREFMSEGWEEGAKEIIENICDYVNKGESPFLSYLE